MGRLNSDVRLLMRTQTPLLALFVMAMSGCNVSISTTPPEKIPTTSGTSAQQVEAFEAAKGIVKSLDKKEFDRKSETVFRIVKDSPTQNKI